MIDFLPVLAEASKAPLESPAWDGLKGFINSLSVPQVSLPFFFFPLFLFMLFGYRWWTKPIVFVTICVVFMVAYFGAMLIDMDYLLILQKADNVPITIMLIGTGFCLWLAFRQAALNDERLEAGKPLLENDKEDRVLVWPDLVYTELIAIVLATAVLILWSVLLRAPLEAPANPAGPPNPSKAPWYFLGLQEMLVYFDPWMAGVILPGMIVSGLVAMPFFDTNPKGNGYYTFKQRRFAISMWLFGFIILWVVLIVFGTFLRGPNWNFFGPFAFWDSHRQVPLTNVNMSDYFWNGRSLLPSFLSWAGLSKPLPKNPFIRELPGLIMMFIWVVILPLVLARTLFRRMLLQMGGIRFAIMVIHLMIMALMPLKMVLRWTANLKYFIYLPEFNLNL